ncbi:MAG: S-methyl-5-thioribose-1-phosphate isomerase, partial [Nitrospirota bacterium]
CKDYRMVAHCIKELIIRGAPAIGIAAAMGLALGAREIDTADYDKFIVRFSEIADTIASTRPTAVNLFWAIERIRGLVNKSKGKSVEDIRSLICDEAKNILEEDISSNRQIGRNGARLIEDGDTVLTHCNAGALATGGYGTALGVIRAAHEEGKKLMVFADETRPVLQGARLTAWELKEDGIDVTLITDNMAGYMMSRDLVDLCIVGADRIAANGDTANKIGTYTVAVLAREHGIAFYVAAPSSTVDGSISSGNEIVIEERNPEEVTHIMGKIRVAPIGVSAANPAFDVTPARYITAIITEKGVFKPEEIGKTL